MVLVSFQAAELIPSFLFLFCGAESGSEIIDGVAHCVGAARPVKFQLIDLSLQELVVGYYLYV
jgi:hypothetical protein